MTATHPITTALIAAIAHSDEPMVLTDPHGPDHPMIAINPAFERLTGYAAADTVGRNCRFLQGAGTDPETPRRIARSIAARRGCIEWVLNYRRDGAMFWNLLFIIPVFDEAGALLHFFGNQRDVTDGPPPGLPDFALGRADLPLWGQEEFHAVLSGIAGTASDDEGRARALERVVDAARWLNEATTSLVAPPWQPPPR